MIYPNHRHQHLLTKREKNKDAFFLCPFKLCWDLPQLNNMKLLKKNALAHGLYDIYHRNFKIHVNQLPKLY